MKHDSKKFSYEIWADDKDLYIGNPFYFRSLIPLISEVQIKVHSVHWRLNLPLKNTTSFLPSPSLNLQTVQVPPFPAIRTLKIGFFSEPSSY